VNLIFSIKEITFIIEIIISFKIQEEDSSIITSRNVGQFGQIMLMLFESNNLKNDLISLNLKHFGAYKLRIIRELIKIILDLMITINQNILELNETDMNYFKSKIQLLNDQIKTWVTENLCKPTSF
jgi:hypothetical protein